ncbi:MAG: sigma 54-interacting transcriptional regulator [Acidobacteriota bacterium]
MTTSSYMETTRPRTFDDLLGSLSTRFVECRADAVDGLLEDSLRSVVEHFDFDRSTLAQLHPPDELWITHSWARSGIEPVPTQSLDRMHPMLGSRLRRGEVVGFGAVDELPATARSIVEATGLQANLTLPLRVGGEIVAALAFGSFRAPRAWRDELVGKLRLIAELFASVLVRRQHDAEIRRLQARLEAENVYLRQEIATSHHEIIGRAPALQAALYKVEQVAPTAAPVLILGETGTGKELFARAVHDQSPRRERSLVKVNCAALPATLIESELFGHVKGAFTGATQNKAGRFELADGGTLFLDEIGEMDLDLQAKLLRVLQEGEFEPVGASATKKVDVRIVAATNRDFATSMAEGRFRSDLYYRLSVFPIELPPLRERSEDIPLLVALFVERGNKSLGRQVSQIPQPVMDALTGHDWPGNVRELQNIVDRALILSSGATLELDPSSFRPPSSEEPIAEPRSPRLCPLREVEREHVLGVLEAVGWKINGKGHAADILGLHPSTLRHRLKSLDIKRRT